MTSHASKSHKWKSGVSGEAEARLWGALPASCLPVLPRTVWGRSCGLSLPLVPLACPGSPILLTFQGPPVSTPSSVMGCSGHEKAEGVFRREWSPELGRAAGSMGPGGYRHRCSGTKLEEAIGYLGEGSPK